MAAAVKYAEQASMGSLVASNAEFVPATAEVVSPAVLAQVFDDRLIPFELNSDGSADAATYKQWLERIGTLALQDAETHSEIIQPRKARTARRIQKV